MQQLIPEWAEQAAIVLAWPYQQGDFQRWQTEVESVYDAIAKAISWRQGLIVLCRDGELHNRVSQRLNAIGARRENIRLLMLPYDDVWVRDTAPLAINDGVGGKWLDFRFNGWGGKYPHTNDAALAGRLLASGLLGSRPMERVDYVLEGGSIETDGRGSVLTTSRCLLNPNRNPTYDQAGIEAVLRRQFGAERVLWVDHGEAEGDDTDAHVDTLVRFCSPDTLAYTACDDPRDSMFATLGAMAAQLAEFRTAKDQPYRLVPLPIPKAILDEDGERLPATYANFLIINGAVLIPVYGDPADDVAVRRLADCFPDREIVPIDCTALIRQYGSLHCMTMQLPKSMGVPIHEN